MISRIGYSDIGLWVYINRLQLLMAMLGIGLLVLGIKAVYFTGSESLMGALDFYFLPGLGAIGLAFGAELKALINRYILRREKHHQLEVN